ncbi:hypothetical protein THF1C08_10445 [Vibrio jasicida]|uniref:Uncharacterized protein n=1 Tax=Vibrio jasicida TaxID=766224 RepID=A0AAU9QE27_9VIBR|nr:hypothetical protein THF1C08_10445 [Vibrio jasicida]CAH1566104.1 hypothetical protein THF1A12_10446 [Vibrio jasicida]
MHPHLETLIYLRLIFEYKNEKNLRLLIKHLMCFAYIRRTNEVKFNN